jgi:DME family drug/metabolite transporter
VAGGCLPSARLAALRRSGAPLVLAAAALWAQLGPVSRLAYEHGAVPLQVAFLRALLAAPLFALRGRALPARRDLLPAALFGLISVSLLYGSNQLAVSLGGATLASVLLYSAPVWVAVLSPAVLGEPLTRARIAGVAVAVIGVGLVSVAGGTGAHFDLAAVGWGLVSGVAYASTFLAGKRLLAGRPQAPLLAVAMFAGALGLLPFAHLPPLDGVAWAALIFLAVFSTFGAYSLYYAGLRHLPAAIASVLATLEPVIAAAVAYVWWKERLGPVALAGAALILAGAVGLALTEHR